jgi:hypothetical protein
VAIGVISPGAKWNLKGSQKPTRWTRTFFDVWVAVEYCDLILWNVLSDWLLVFVMAFVGSSCLQPEVELSLVKWAFIISYICYFGCLLSLPYHADNTFKNFNILSDVALEHYYKPLSYKSKCRTPDEGRHVESRSVQLPTT